MLNVLEKGKPENWPPFFCLAGGDPTGGAVSRGSGQSSLRLLRLRFGPLLLRAVRRGDQRQTAGLSGSTLHRLPAAVQRLHSRCNTQIFKKNKNNLTFHFKLGCFVFPVRCGGHPGEAGRQQEEEKNHRKFPKRWLPGESKQHLLERMNPDQKFRWWKWQLCQIQCLLLRGCHWPKGLLQWRCSLWAPACLHAAAGDK